MRNGPNIPKRQPLGHLSSHAPRSQREHQAGGSAEKNTDADERANHPFGAVGPSTPDENAQNQGDDSVQQEPHCAGSRAMLEEKNNFHHSFDEQIKRKSQSKSRESAERMLEQVECDDAVQDSY